MGYTGMLVHGNLFQAPLYPNGTVFASLLLLQGFHLPTVPAAVWDRQTLQNCHQHRPRCHFLLVHVEYPFGSCVFGTGSWTAVVLTPGQVAVQGPKIFSGWPYSKRYWNCDGPVHILSADAYPFWSSYAT